MMRFVQFFESTLGCSKVAVVIRENPTHADLQVFSNNQNGCELVQAVRKIDDFEEVKGFPCFAEYTQTINGEVSAGIGETAEPKEPVAVSEELGRETERGE